MTAAKRWLVAALETACGWTHWVTHRRPWRTFARPCPLASASERLDARWTTDVWFTVCKRCGSHRVESDMGKIGGDSFCHPSTSAGATCYERETWES